MALQKNVPKRQWMLLAYLLRRHLIGSMNNQTMFLYHYLL